MFGRLTDTLCVFDDLLNGGGFLIGTSCDMIGKSRISFFLHSKVVLNLFGMGVFVRVVF